MCDEPKMVEKFNERFVVHLMKIYIIEKPVGWRKSRDEPCACTLCIFTFDQEQSTITNEIVYISPLAGLNVPYIFYVYIKRRRNCVLVCCVVCHAPSARTC